MPFLLKLAEETTGRSLGMPPVPVLSEGSTVSAQGDSTFNEVVTVSDRHGDHGKGSGEATLRVSVFACSDNDPLTDNFGKTEAKITVPRVSATNLKS